MHTCQVEGATAAEPPVPPGVGIVRSSSAAEMLRKRLREAEEPVLASGTPPLAAEHGAAPALMGASGWLPDRQHRAALTPVQ